ncbi:MAG: biotin--[acetyl-CoA-carboxylase] ligase [Rhizobiaceae bacterium]|nr:biotin--[acetyl-CoA-carboxylase] ligase [Hyphomicrobiales bacterium]NRB29665.1 biotin--[acetyl-CoA-carboxylase] ligase [Rhizobiaceae bacterium]
MRSIEGLTGWRHLALGDVGSTNAVALEQAVGGDPGQLWITAESQSAGRARRGRSWVSEPGNLYASLLLLDPAPQDKLATLPLVISLALHLALVEARPELGARLKIKWPNDLLLDGKKLSGILLEAQPDGHGRLAVIIGCGINCQHFPDNPLYPATSLAASGIALEPAELFSHLAREMARTLRIWAEGQGIAIIRRDWLDRCHGIGQEIVARFPDREISGKFVDLDDNGLLLLCDNKGQIHTISAADIFFGN